MKVRLLDFCSFYYKYSSHVYAFMLIYPSVQLWIGGKCIVSGEEPEDKISNNCGSVVLQP